MFTPLFAMRSADYLAVVDTLHRNGQAVWQTAWLIREEVKYMSKRFDKNVRKLSKRLMNDTTEELVEFYVQAHKVFQLSHEAWVVAKLILVVDEVLLKFGTKRGNAFVARLADGIIDTGDRYIFGQAIILLLCFLGEPGPSAQLFWGKALNGEGVQPGYMQHMIEYWIEKGELTVDGIKASGYFRYYEALLAGKPLDPAAEYDWPPGVDFAV